MNELAEVRLLTVVEVASLLRVSKMTIYRLVSSGDLDHVRVGRSIRIYERSVRKYLPEG